MISIHDYVAILIDADNAQLSYIEQVLKISQTTGNWKYAVLMVTGKNLNYLPGVKTWTLEKSTVSR